MIRLSKSVLAVGGVVLAAGLITFTNPKTVHAVAAALVQVTNTASNPVVTQSTSQQATQLVQLTCNITTSGEARGVGSGQCHGLPTGTVPSNQSLVVTAVDISLTNLLGSCVTGGTYPENLQVEGSSTVAYTWTLSFSGPTFEPTTHFTYPSGIVFPPNSMLVASEISGCPADFELTGYLTNN
jgi:hypothetical protein